MTTEEQAKAIVEKYRSKLPFKLAPNYAIKCAINCAITEVEACIETANDSIAFKQSKRDRLNDILSHLKQM
jgi:hypothetical protein